MAGRRPRSPESSTRRRRSSRKTSTGCSGAHSLSFGGMWIRPFEDADGPFQANGSFSFNGTRTGGATRPGPARHGRLPRRAPELLQPGRQPDCRREDELRRPVRAGRVARQQPADAQRRPPLGTVPRGEGSERVHDGVQPGLVQPESPQRDVSECARRPDVRRRRRIPEQRREHRRIGTTSSRPAAA